LEGGISVEDDVLLPEEDPGNSQKGDAEHWISVYQELLDHNRRLLNHMRNHDEAEMETQPLERHIQRLEARLALWEKGGRIAGRRPRSFP
jgi:hypothetical protein